MKCVDESIGTSPVSTGTPQKDFILSCCKENALCSTLTPSVRGDPLRGPKNKFHHPQPCD